MQGQKNPPVGAITAPPTYRNPRIEKNPKNQPKNPKNPKNRTESQKKNE
jgi:hypothetical protein